MELVPTVLKELTEALEALRGLQVGRVGRGLQVSQVPKRVELELGRVASLPEVLLVLDVKVVVEVALAEMVEWATELHLLWFEE